MLSALTIETVSQLPAGLEKELLLAAAQEKFGALERLRQDWLSGANQFSDPGEGFYVARVRGRLIGVGGLNRDPYAGEPEIGRIRRLYALPVFRRQGVGQALAQRIISDGQAHFRIFRLRTVDSRASDFYISLGFSSVTGQSAFTHQLIIDPTDRDNRPMFSGPSS